MNLPIRARFAKVTVNCNTMQTLLPIICEPDPRLRQRSVPVAEKEIKEPEFQKFVQDLGVTMEKADGVGLAAPQVAVLKRVIAVQTKDGPTVLINPELVKRSWAKEWGEEGCLSVPKVFGQVRRHLVVTCRFLDRNAVPRKIEAEGLMARVLQHEIDHLNGILFIDTARDLRRID
jgi:peptide deformylase